MDGRASKKRKLSSTSSLPPLPPILSPHLATAAFTHQATADASSSPTTTSYERLEFLGDAYIELISSRLIYSRFPALGAGRMSQKRESMVKNETLAKYALGYGFDERARLPGDVKGGGKAWCKVMGDIFEAYVAAVILSDPIDGLAAVERWLEELWAPMLVAEKETEGRLNENAKVELSQMVGGKGVRVEYKTENEVVAARKETRAVFEVGSYLTGWGCEGVRVGGGRGPTVKEAGWRAAMEAMGCEVVKEAAGRKKVYDKVVRMEREREEMGDETKQQGVNGQKGEAFQEKKKDSASGKKKG